MIAKVGVKEESSAIITTITELFADWNMALQAGSIQLTVVLAIFVYWSTKYWIPLARVPGFPIHIFTF